MFFLSLSHKIQLLVFQQEFLCFAVFPISPSPNLRACRSEFGGREPLYSPHYFPIFNPHLTSTLLHLLSGEYTIRNSNKNYYFSLQYKNLIYPHYFPIFNPHLFFFATSHHNTCRIQNTELKKNILLHSPTLLFILSLLLGKKQGSQPSSFHCIG